MMVGIKVAEGGMRRGRGGGGVSSSILPSRSCLFSLPRSKSFPTAIPFSRKNTKSARQQAPASDKQVMGFHSGGAPFAEIALSVKAAPERARRVALVK
jgi:hypothetical protein